MVVQLTRFCGNMDKSILEPTQVVVFGVKWLSLEGA